MLKLNLNNKESNLRLYRTKIVDFIKIVLEKDNFSSFLTFIDKQLLISELGVLRNKPVKVVYLDYQIYLEYKDSLINFNVAKDKALFVKNYLSSKGISNVDVQPFGDFPIIYLKLNLDEFQNIETMNLMAKCISDFIDVITCLFEVSDQKTKILLYDLLEELGYHLLNNPNSNLRFYFDSINNNDRCDQKEILKITNLVEFEQDINMKLLEFDKPELE